MTNKKKRRSKARRTDPQKLEKLRHRRKVQSVFKRIGFSRILSDGVEFKYDGRTGEIDDIFLAQNIVVLCEYTIGKATHEHVAKKTLLYEKILKAPSSWISSYSEKNARFKATIEAAPFDLSEFRVRIVYASTQGVGEEIEASIRSISFLDGTRLRYFDLLSNTIQKSARHEMFKYLGIDYAEVGDQVHSSASHSRSFPGSLLPEAHSGYPRGFKVVSMYAEPATLLALSYVLRQDSWRDSDGLYQRILIKSKIARMRRYLVEAKRVFVNNIIVTLPPNTVINDPVSGKNVDASTLEKVSQVSVSVPYSANMIGLVDGQHRVFCYYEGSDPLEDKIAKLRVRQNLLVTGLVFPSSWSDTQKREFEARLFLEINDNQARAKSALKQNIELILNPFSTTAIAKEIVNRLAVKGPLEDLLQVSFFDPPHKIKTTSIVSYGLRPLVKLDGDDSLFSCWRKSGKRARVDDSTDSDERKRLLAEYVEHCATSINHLLAAVKKHVGTDRWNPKPNIRKQFLTPTVINGLFVTLRHLAESKKIGHFDIYDVALQDIGKFSFTKYKSSGWKSLGDDIFNQFFS
jgi:DGQHR domain-containing protein